MAQITEYLKKLYEPKDGDESSSTEETMIDNEALENLSKLRKVDISEYKKDWDDSKATDADQ